MRIFLALPVCVLFVTLSLPDVPQRSASGLSAEQPAGGSSPVAVRSRVLFNRDIRPILSDHCFACHGPDKNKRQARLRLDERTSALQKQAIVPGKLQESKLVERILSRDATEVMPPPEYHKPLSREQIELLQQWIEEGAEYQPHWAYITPVRPAVPVVQQKEWVRNPVDAFILAELEKRQIAPSPEAEPETLIRRLSLDLIGLPPPPELTQPAFLQQPDWYEKAVDQLLASPHYGERMAVPWLDLVRYADTVGYHGDQNQRIFPYRDYVIDAFNSNMPFDQFTREQLAGDLLPNATLRQKVATGFNRLNMMTREGGAQPEEYLAKYAADRVRTVAGTWLGSTVGCAECHDHKYDPFTMKDFYALSAYFSDMKQWGVYNDYSYTPNPDLKGWSNDHPFPPEIEVESPYLQQRMARLLQAMQTLAPPATDPGYLAWKEERTRQPALRVTPPVEVQLSEAANTKKPSKEAGKEGTRVAQEGARATGKEGDADRPPEQKTEPEETAEVLPDGSVLFGGPVKSTPTLVLQLPAGWLACLRLELLVPEGEGSILRTGQASSNFKPVFQWERPGQKPQPLAIRFADADRKETLYRNGFDVLGVQDNWRTSARERKLPHTSLWWLQQPIQAQAGDKLLVRIPTNLLRNIRVSVSGYAPASLKASTDTPVYDPLSYLRSTGQPASAFARLQQLEASYRECREGKAMTQVTEAVTPRVTRVLPRGNFLDTSGEIVTPQPPAFLPGPAGTSRLDLARWLTAPENPLTARVAVNRYWKMLFGNGLSNVPDDFGAQGEWPTHPELLDWLAVEYRESGWDTKRLLQLLVLSHTYRQSAVTRTELKELDPNNRLLAAQNPRRLEAEFIRDQALAVAGLLNRDIGGPSAFPYQPPGYYTQLQFPDRDYHASQDERQYRRGVYSHWQRTFLHPMLANFDAPSREECTASRMTANSPQQALTLLNDPSLVEAARVFADSLLQEPGDDATHLQRAFQRTLVRAAKPAESERLLALLHRMRQHYRENVEEAKALLRVGQSPVRGQHEAAELAAWTNVLRVLLNLHETLTRY